MRRWWLSLPAFFLAACSSDTTGPGVAPEAPETLASTTLDGAIALTWSDNPFQSDPDIFEAYAVYSASYDLDADLCGSFRLEGTTVAPEFVVGALTNGAPRCFRVTAVSIDGLESGPSPRRHDTPRPDARNIALYARQFQDAGSGFRFWEDVDGDGTVDRSELGRVLAGSSTAADFTVERDGEGRLFLTPAFAGAEVALYGSAPVEDLTSITVAPDAGYDVTGIEAIPGWGYVFQIDDGGPFFSFGAVRVTHVGQNLLILDWAYQTDPGNPELRVAGR